MRTASGLAMSVVVIALLAAAGGALKFYMDDQWMRGMIDAYGATLSSLPLPPGPASQAFVAARERASAGDYATAQAKLKEGAASLAQAAAAGPGTQGPGPGAGGEPTQEMLQQALTEIPAPARRFFEEHTDLLREATALRMAAGAGRVDIPGDRLQKLVDQMVEAAGQNDEKRVRSTLDEMRKGMRRGGAGPGRMGGAMGGPSGGEVSADQIRGAVAEARAILARSRQAGMNTGRGPAVLDEAESLLNGGKLEAAAAKLREFFGMMRETLARGRPRGGGPGPGGGGRGPRGVAAPQGERGPSPMPAGMAGFLPVMAGALLGEMQMESPLLRGILDDLEAAGSAILETNGDQIREILDRATGKLLRIRKDRSELDEKLAEEQRKAMEEWRNQAGGPGQQPGMGPGGRGQRPGTERGGPGQSPGTMPGGLPFDPQEAHDLIGRALDEARALSEEEYAQQKEEFVQRLVAGLLSKGRSPAGAGLVVGSPLPPIELPKEEPTEPEARDKLETTVRERLRVIQEPYNKLTEIGVDMSEVGRLIRQARQAVNQGELLEATKYTNHGSDLILRLVDMHRAELNQARREGKPSE